MIEQEISELSREIAALLQRIERLDVELAPVTRQEFEIRERIGRTHERRSGPLLLFNPAGAEARRPMFERLMDIAVRFGKVKAERSELRSRMKAYEKRVEVLSNEMERERKRAMKKTKAKPVKPKHEILGELLHHFGVGRIDRERFWREMNLKGYTQADIDQWCADDAREAKQNTRLI